MEQIVTGTVMDNWEEEHPGKIQVSYTLGEQGEVQTDWMPVMCSYAASGCGSYTLPEVGATVVVGFVYGNPNCPLVLGSVWSQDNPMPEETANENNSKKRWKTKAGYELLVDEEENLIRVTDPAGQNTVEWSSEEDHGHLTINVMEKVDISIGGEPFLTLEKEKVTFAGAVTVQAEGMAVQTEKAFSVEAGEDMKLKSDGMDLEAGKDLEMKASGNVKASGKNIELSPTQKLSVSGANVEIKPSQGATVKANQLKIEALSLEMKANASAKVESGGILQLKGSMMKLN